MSLFASHPCFTPEFIGINTRGEACVAFDAILAKFDGTYEARRALGDPHNPERRALCEAEIAKLSLKTQDAIAKADRAARARKQTETVKGSA